MRFPGFIGPSYTLQSVNVDCQRCVNLFPEMNALGTGKEREVASLVPTPGLRLLLALPTYPYRGAWRASNDVLFVVAGNKFYRVSSAWAYTELGTLDTSEGPVSIADNGIQVVMVDGQFGYSYDIAGATFAKITDEDFYPADFVTFLDGYFVFNKTGTNEFFHSDLLSVDFDALDFAKAEGSPDAITALIAANQNLYLFGPQSTEVFYNSGDPNQVFQRIQGAMIDVGISAPWSLQKISGGALIFVGGDATGTGTVYQMVGYQVQRVSTPSVESVIRSVPAEKLVAARAWTYQQGGHQFYCLNLPGIDSTWCYDVSTGLWHERVYLGNWGWERHRAECAAVAYGENVVGDYKTGNLYALDPDRYNDDGNSIIRVRRAPHFSGGLVKIRHNRFQLDMETGVGLDGEGQGTNPRAMLRWSDDGGHSWSNERWAEIGRIGAKEARVIWRRLGSSRDRVYEVSISDPVKPVLIGAELDVEKGVA